MVQSGWILGCYRYDLPEEEIVISSIEDAATNQCPSGMVNGSKIVIGWRVPLVPVVSIDAFPRSDGDYNLYVPSVRRLSSEDT